MTYTASILPSRALLHYSEEIDIFVGYPRYFPFFRQISPPVGRGLREKYESKTKISAADLSSRYGTDPDIRLSVSGQKPCLHFEICRYALFVFIRALHAQEARGSENDGAFFDVCSRRRYLSGALAADPCTPVCGFPRRSVLLLRLSVPDRCLSEECRV
jgi:hypothetical protein